MKIENDWHGYSKAEKIILVVILGLVVLVVISWAADGFACSMEYHKGYKAGIIDWNKFSADTSHHFECPFSYTAPYSDFCREYV